jgi:hypothetical protein
MIQRLIKYGEGYDTYDIVLPWSGSRQAADARLAQALGRHPPVPRLLGPSCLLSLSSFCQYSSTSFAAVVVVVIAFAVMHIVADEGTFFAVDVFIALSSPSSSAAAAFPSSSSYSSQATATFVPTYSSA